MSRTIRHKASPIPFPVRVPFVESLGIELHGYSPGHAELRVDLDEAHLNAWEVAHGGVVMTLLDVAMAMVARSMTGHAGGVATVEMKTSFFRPAEHQLRSVAKVLHHTSTLVFCEGSLFDDEGVSPGPVTGDPAMWPRLEAAGAGVQPVQEAVLGQGGRGVRRLNPLLEGLLESALESKVVVDVVSHGSSPSRRGSNCPALARDLLNRPETVQRRLGQGRLRERTRSALTRPSVRLMPRPPGPKSSTRARQALSR